MTFEAARFEAARRASQGVRNNQEDCAVLWPGGDDPFAPATDLCEAGRLDTVLADGMGGHAGGALASRAVCEHFLLGYSGQIGPTRDRLRGGLASANRAIELVVEGNPALSGMGSTLIGAVFGPDGLEWISVGDSPLYLYRRGEIALLNEDHSLAPALDQLAAAGKITHEEARTDPRRHMLRSAITGEDLDLVDLSVKPLALQPGDYVVLASDGIHTLDEGEIARLITAYAADGPKVIASALIRSVDNMRDPQQDNTTVVVVRRSEG